MHIFHRNFFLHYDLKKHELVKVNQHSVYEMRDTRRDCWGWHNEENKSANEHRVKQGSREQFFQCPNTQEAYDRMINIFDVLRPVNREGSYQGETKCSNGHS